MTEILTADGYESTKTTLRELEVQLAEIDKHTELDLDHLASSRRTCRSMIRVCRQQMAAYEAELEQQVELAGAS